MVARKGTTELQSHGAYAQRLPYATKSASMGRTILSEIVWSMVRTPVLRRVPLTRPDRVCLRYTFRSLMFQDAF